MKSASDEEEEHLSASQKEFRRKYDVTLLNVLTAKDLGASNYLAVN